MKSIRPGLVGLLCLGILHMGCAGAFTLPREELPKLDGLRPGEERTLRDCRGDPVPVTAETPLRLALSTGMEPRERFSTVTVRDGIFRGTTPDGRIIEISLEEIECVRIPGSDLSAVAIGAVAVGIVLVVWALIVLTTPDDEG